MSSTSGYSVSGSLYSDCSRWIHWICSPRRYSVLSTRYSLLEPTDRTSCEQRLSKMTSSSCPRVELKNLSSINLSWIHNVSSSVLKFPFSFRFRFPLRVSFLVNNILFVFCAIGWVVGILCSLCPCSCYVEFCFFTTRQEIVARKSPQN